jgi:hypothetical protein
VAGVPIFRPPLCGAVSPRGAARAQDGHRRRTPPRDSAQAADGTMRNGPPVLPMAGRTRTRLPARLRAGGLPSGVTPSGRGRTTAANLFSSRIVALAGRSHGRCTHFHRMTRPNHRMSQNTADPTEKRAHFPNHARVVRCTRRQQNVPPSLSKIWTPGRDTTNRSSDESVESSDKSKYGGSYREAGTFSKPDTQHDVHRKYWGASNPHEGCQHG